MEAASCFSVALHVVCDLVEETQSVEVLLSVGCSVVILISVLD